MFFVTYMNGKSVQAAQRSPHVHPVLGIDSVRGEVDSLLEDRIHEKDWKHHVSMSLGVRSDSTCELCMTEECFIFSLYLNTCSPKAMMTLGQAARHEFSATVVGI